MGTKFYDCMSNTSTCKKHLNANLKAFWKSNQCNIMIHIYRGSS